MPLGGDDGVSAPRSFAGHGLPCPYCRKSGGRDARCQRRKGTTSASEPSNVAACLSSTSLRPYFKGALSALFSRRLARWTRGALVPPNRPRCGASAPGPRPRRTRSRGYFDFRVLARIFFAAVEPEPGFLNRSPAMAGSSECSTLQKRRRSSCFWRIRSDSSSFFIAPLNDEARK